MSPGIILGETGFSVQINGVAYLPALCKMDLELIKPMRFATSCVSE